LKAVGQPDQGDTNNIYSLDLLKTVLETSKAHPIWQNRLLLLIGVKIINPIIKKKFKTILV
jgi:hypothetical protein